MKAPAGFGTIMRGDRHGGRRRSRRSRSWCGSRPSAPRRGSRGCRSRARASRTIATSTSKVELRNVQGGFQRLRNARRVFVISGDARNNSPMTDRAHRGRGCALRSRRRRARSEGRDDRATARRSRTSPRRRSCCSSDSIRRSRSRPGETTPFLIVFLEPPRELREFSSRVLSVRPTRRASTPPCSGRAGTRWGDVDRVGLAGRLAEVADALAEPFTELRQLAGAEDDQDDHQDHQHLSHPQTEHAILQRRELRSRDYRRTFREARNRACRRDPLRRMRVATAS